MPDLTGPQTSAVGRTTTPRPAADLTPRRRRGGGPSRVTVSVVICAYTEARWDDLRAAVRSVLTQRPAPLELILVIDHCPALLERAQATFTDAVVVANTQRQGLSGARNVGVENARGDVVAFLDDDARAEPGWLAALVEGYQYPAVQGVGGAVEPRWETGRPRWFPREFDWVVGCSHSGMPAETAPVRNFVGANMSLRRSALIELGGFSAELGRRGADVAGCEETELCIRAGSLRPDATLRYLPAARVTHTVPASRATVRYFVRRCVGEGRSKAAVARMVGEVDGLSSERAYVTQTLPRGVLRGLAVPTRDGFAGPLRALAIIVGFLATLYGYARGRLTLPMSLMTRRQR